MVLLNVKSLWNTHVESRGEEYGRRQRFVCQCLDGQWSNGSKCDQDHIRKHSSKEHPYLEISIEGEEHWVHLEGIFGIYEETGPGVMEANFYQMLLHEKSGQKITH